MNKICNDQCANNYLALCKIMLCYNMYLYILEKMMGGLKQQCETSMTRTILSHNQSHCPCFTNETS